MRIIKTERKRANNYERKKSGEGGTGLEGHIDKYFSYFCLRVLKKIGRAHFLTRGTRTQNSNTIDLLPVLQFFFLSEIGIISHTERFPPNGTSVFVFRNFFLRALFIPATSILLLLKTY